MSVENGNWSDLCEPGFEATGLINEVIQKLSKVL